MARKAKKSPAEWKQQIMQAAQSQFFANGFEQTSISDIMERAGGAKGTFYLYFDSKDQLLEALIDEWAQSYTEQMTAALSIKGISFTVRLQTIMAVIEQMAKRTMGLEAFFKQSNALMLDKLTKRMTDIFVPQLTDILEAGVNQGIINIDDPAFYARFIIYGSLGALNAGDGLPHEKIPKNLAALPSAILNLLGLEQCGKYI